MTTGYMRLFRIAPLTLERILHRIACLDEERKDTANTGEVRSRAGVRDRLIFSADIKDVVDNACGEVAKGQLVQGGRG